MENCIFCQIAEHKTSANIIYEDDEILVFKDINPQAPVHLLTIPRTHIARIQDLEETDLHLMGKLIYRAKQQAENLGLHQNGYRLVFNNGRDGGQAVYHIHLHLLGGRAMRWPPG